MVSLHPEAKEQLARLEREGVPPLDSLSVRELRDEFSTLTRTDDEGPTVGAVDERKVQGPNGDVPIRVYTPRAPSPPYPVITYLHGGGWVMGSLDSVDPLCRVLTAASGCLTVSVDYRLAPEHPFPAGLRDCDAVVRWLAEHAGSIDGIGEHIALAGDSAGGNLAAALGLLAGERGSPTIRCLLLVYPQLNYAFDTASYRENAEGYYLTRAAMRRFWDWYLTRELDGYHPLASPLRARDELLKTLPTTRLLTCGFDPLRDDGAAFAERLADVGVDVRHRIFESMIHGFFRQVTELDVAREAATDVAAEIGEEL